eukprot:m.1519034 g.1519034  ORF g.1519034 m.1519034 type:complete len:129 (-) comp25223_c0_seq2:1800-2186(-)
MCHYSRNENILLNVCNGPLESVLDGPHDLPMATHNSLSYATCIDRTCSAQHTTRLIHCGACGLVQVLCRAIANLVLQSIWTQDGYVFPQVRRQKEIQRIIHASTTPSAEHTFASTLHHYLVANLAAVR